MDEGVLRDLLTANPADESAAEALGRVLASSERWGELVQLLLDRIEHPGGARAALYLRLAETLHRHLDQSSEALVVLLEGVEETDADDQLSALIEEVATSTDNWSEVLSSYETRLERASNPQVLHRRLASWYRRAGRRSDEMRHRLALGQHDPDDVTNSEILENHYEETEAWHELVGLLEGRLEHQTDPDARRELSGRIGLILDEKLSRPRAALDWYGLMFREFPEHALLETLVRLIKASGEYERSVSLLDAALAEPHRCGETQRQVYLLVASLCHHQLEDPDRALEAYANASKAGPWDPEIASQLRRLSRQRGNWAALVEQLGQDIEETSDGEARFQLLTELGETQGNHQGDHTAAIEAWYAALELKPDHKPTLVRLMDLFRQTEQWEASIKSLKKLTSLEMDLKKRAQYFHAIGVIQRDKLSDSQAAVRSFDLALEFDPGFLRAFQAIDEVLNAEQNYERQDRYYRKMLVRALDNNLDENLISTIARNLGQINHLHLNDPEEAVKAFDIAIRYGCTDRSLYQLTADLEGSIGRVDSAAEKYESLIAADPTDLDPYHALVTLYCGANRLDDAFCVCRVLMVLGHATPEESALERSVRRGTTHQQLKPMQGEAWAFVSAGFRYPQVGELLKWLTAPLLSSVALTEKALGIEKGASSEHGERLVALTTSILQLKTPEVKISGRFPRVGIGHLDVPVVLVHPDVGTHSKAEQLFSSVRTLFMFDHRHYLATIDTGYRKRMARLKSLLATVHQWLMPDRAQPGCMPELLSLLNEYGGHERDICLELIAPLLGLKDYGIAEWLRSVENSANRIAFTICDDLETAIRMIRQDPYPMSDESANNRIIDILRYAISRDYRQLRQELRIAAPSPGQERSPDTTFDDLDPTTVQED